MAEAALSGGSGCGREGDLRPSHTALTVTFLGVAPVNAPAILAAPSGEAGARDGVKFELSATLAPIVKEASVVRGLLLGARPDHRLGVAAKVFPMALRRVTFSLSFTGVAAPHGPARA